MDQDNISFLTFLMKCSIYQKTLKYQFQWYKNGVTTKFCYAPANHVQSMQPFWIENVNKLVCYFSIIFNDSTLSREKIFKNLAFPYNQQQDLFS